MEALLPNSFNPLQSRIIVISFFGLVWMGSHRSEHVKRHISKYFSACIWLVTTHYYYLLFHNHSDVNFVVGTYILVLGVFACFQSERALLTYATYTLFLSGVLCYLVADLRKTVFLPGLITIFTFSYIAIRQRLKLMTQTRQSSTKIVELFTQVQKGQKDRILFEATREALKIRDDFISIASHELKTPLTSLKLQNEIARRKFSRGPLPAEQTMLLISQVDRQVDRLTRLVEDMIEISRFSSGKFKIVRETFNLSALIADCILSLSQMLQEAGCKLNFEGHQEILISADRFRIEQVLINLLTNAAKYGQSKPIVVRAEKDDIEVRITVEDHGMGIERDQQERIFKRFERAVSSKHISGLGLGLFISKQIIEAHKGKIDVHSESGQGAQFVVRLPLSH